ncbi:MAG: hypothetical protein K8I82_25250 [Anaerolineae bacterium]|nr:hypothetical protein [Anaerolineae bacterium]
MVDFRLLDARVQEAVHTTPFHEWIFPDGTLWTQFYRTDMGYLLRFPDLADFQVSADGLTVTCYPAPDVTDDTPQHLYLNQVLPLALSKQGKLVFHASAVEIDGVAVAFMGESSKGKSTLAASFATGGFRFLTDDGLMVEVCGDGYRIMPSHPSIRLWQDSEAALIAPDTPTAPTLEFTSKSRFLAGETIPFCDSPRPLRRVYFLGDGSAPEVMFQRMRPAEALIELVKHSFLLDIEEREMLAAHFDELSSLANLPIYYLLDYPRRYEDLAAVRQAIIEHAKEESEVV